MVVGDIEVGPAIVEGPNAVDGPVVTVGLTFPAVTEKNVFEQMSKPCFPGFYFVSSSRQNQCVIGENVFEFGGFDDNDIQLVLQGLLRYGVGKELRECRGRGGQDQK